ncbi:hypothetical protein DFR69_103355 [Nocardia neocaledoniensis]|uniref:Uncharacterized protein n=1 Tax=Nocardia neocaledoniensis TaxID=236511 RepID=A0A317NQV3_9NOCA|nr:hypothetical protein DFR69_103355 [Nocardia neocaledoniensis]
MGPVVGVGLGPNGWLGFEDCGGVGLVPRSCWLVGVDVGVLEMAVVDLGDDGTEGIGELGDAWGVAVGLGVVGGAGVEAGVVVGGVVGVVAGAGVPVCDTGVVVVVAAAVDVSGEVGLVASAGAVWVIAGFDGVVVGLMPGVVAAGVDVAAWVSGVVVTGGVAEVGACCAGGVFAGSGSAAVVCAGRSSGVLVGDGLVSPGVGVSGVVPFVGSDSCVVSPVEGAELVGMVSPVGGVLLVGVVSTGDGVTGVVGLGEGVSAGAGFWVGPLFSGLDGVESPVSGLPFGLDWVASPVFGVVGDPWVSGFGVGEVFPASGALSLGALAGADSVGEGVPFAPLSFGLAVAGSPGAVFCGAVAPSVGEPGSPVDAGLVGSSLFGAAGVSGVPLSVPVGGWSPDGASVDAGVVGASGDSLPGAGESVAGAVAAGVVAPGTSVPSSGTVGACAGDDPPDSTADCTPPAPALVNVSTPMSRLNS